MHGSDWLVLLGGIAAIAWVNWYFFLAGRRSAAASAGPGGMQEVTVVVQGGYSPSEVRVRRGGPVRIVFDRRETSGCTEEVVFPDFGIRRFLPPERKTAVELTPPGTGSYEFACGMGMFRGKVIVE
jgi:plastocyanin domain-containing protein